MSITKERALHNLRDYLANNKNIQMSLKEFDALLISKCNKNLKQWLQGLEANKTLWLIDSFASMLIAEELLQRWAVERGQHDPSAKSNK